MSVFPQPLLTSVSIVVLCNRLCHQEALVLTQAHPTKMTSPWILRQLQHILGYPRPESPRVYVSELLSYLYFAGTLGYVFEAKNVGVFLDCGTFNPRRSMWEKNKASQLVCQAGLVNKYSSIHFDRSWPKKNSLGTKKWQRWEFSFSWHRKLYLWLLCITII